MSILSGPEIERRVKAGEIKIEPFDPDMVSPNSVNLKLADRLLVYRKNRYIHDFYAERHERIQEGVWPSGATHPIDTYLEPLDMAVEEETDELIIPKTGLILWPGVLYLGSTVEYTETPNLVPNLDGRSSVGRLGVVVHLTAGRGDTFFRGTWTTEITVVHPLRVYPGVPVCQISYLTVEGEQKPYAGNYVGQRGPKASQLFRGVRKLLGLD